jgi:5-methylcytosine-specific restriction endonuclease McrA
MTFNPSPKPQHSRDGDDFDHRAHREKAIDVAGKIACFSGRCAFCGRLGEISPHHIVHRSHANTTALVENLLPLCSICHSDAHHDEKRFRAWLEQLKPGLYEKLWLVAREIRAIKIDFAEIYESLLIQYHGMLVDSQKKESL